MKTLDSSKGAEKVKSYKSGDYFGERALLKNEPRAASVIAETDCIVLWMDRNSVKRLLGPLENVLIRNLELYEKFTTN